MLVQNPPRRELRVQARWTFRHIFTRQAAPAAEGSPAVAAAGIRRAAAPLPRQSCGTVKGDRRPEQSSGGDETRWRQRRGSALGRRHYRIAQQPRGRSRRRDDWMRNRRAMQRDLGPNIDLRSRIRFLALPRLVHQPANLAHVTRRKCPFHGFRNRHRVRIAVDHPAPSERLDDIPMTARGQHPGDHRRPNLNPSQRSRKTGPGQASCGMIRM